MRFRQTLFFSLFILLLLTLPVQASELERFAGLEGTVDIAGGTAHIPVMKDAAKAIMRAHPQISITVAGGGSGVGIQKVAEGLVNIGNAGRPVSDKEQTKYPGLTSYPFAVDGVASVVHPDNPVTGLSSSQIQAIFAGQISNWKEVGGEDAEIHLYSRDEASGTRSVFWKKCLKKGTIVNSANIVSSNGAMKSALARDRHGLGYMSIGHIDSSVKSIALDQVAANQKNAINGNYPVVRKLYMNTLGTPTPLTQAFIDYILGRDGANSIANHGYIPLI